MDLYEGMNYAMQLGSVCGSGGKDTVQLHIGRCFRTAGKNVIRMSNRTKNLICRKCGKMQKLPVEMDVNGLVNGSVRVKKGRAIVCCASCGAIRRAHCPKPKNRMKLRRFKRLLRRKQKRNQVKQSFKQNKQSK